MAAECDEHSPPCPQRTDNTIERYAGVLQLEAARAINSDGRDLPSLSVRQLAQSGGAANGREARRTTCQAAAIAEHAAIPCLRHDVCPVA